MLSIIIIILNQTKPKAALEVQKYLLKFYVFILNLSLPALPVVSWDWKSHKKYFGLGLEQEVLEISQESSV